MQSYVNDWSKLLDLATKLDMEGFCGSLKPLTKMTHDELEAKLDKELPELAEEVIDSFQTHAAHAMPDWSKSQLELYGQNRTFAVGKHANESWHQVARADPGYAKFAPIEIKSWVS